MQILLDSGLIAPVKQNELEFIAAHRALIESLYSPEVKEEMTLGEFASEIFHELSLTQ